MLSHTLKVGAHVILHGATYTVRTIPDRTRVQLEHQETGELRNLSRDEFLTFYSTRKLTFIDKITPDPKSAGVQHVRRSEAPPKTALDKASTKRRKHYLNNFEKIFDLAKFSGSSVEHEIKKVALSIGDTIPPSESTLRRWRREGIRGNYGSAVPPARTADRGGRGRARHSAEVESVIAEAIEEIYLTPQRHTIRETAGEIELAIFKQNRERQEDDQLKVPAESTIRNRINSLDAYYVCEKRYGTQYANKKFRAATKSLRVGFSERRLEIDHTPINLFVIDEETGIPCGRPDLTLAIDAATRVVAGFVLSFTGHGADAVLACLKHAILPKTYLATDFPGIKGVWGYHGLPDVLVMDNGPEFHGHSLEDALNELGIDSFFCPKKQPWWKGRVERFLGTQAHSFIHHIPGSTFETVDARKDADPEGTATITLKDLEYLVHKWIVDVYHETVHRGIKMTPNAAWEIAEQQCPPLFPDDVKRLDYIFGEFEERSLQHYGIDLFGDQRYNGVALASLRSVIGPRKVRLKWFRGDIGQIWVEDPSTGDFLEVPNIDQEYAKGLSLLQHNFCREQAKRSNHDPSRRIRLLEAKRALRETVAGLLNSKHIRKRRRAAGLQGHNSTQLRDAATRMKCAFQAYQDEAISAESNEDIDLESGEHPPSKRASDAPKQAANSQPADPKKSSSSPYRNRRSRPPVA